MLKYTVRLVLWTDKNTQGLFPVYIRILIDRQRSLIATGIFIPKKQWDDAGERIKDTHPMASVYNPDLQERKAKIIRFLVEKQLGGERVTAAEVKGRFTGGRDLHNIFQFVDHFIAECRGKKADSTLENYRKHALRLELFHGSRHLAFEEITPEFLRRYEQHLRSPADPKDAVGNNYVAALWQTLKTFFNAAKKRRVITCYPFDEYENPVYQGPGKEHFTLAELGRLEAFADKVTDPFLKQTAVYFLLGCYSGLRLSDWYAFDLKKHVEGERIRIRAEKNGEWVMMPISAPLARNLKRMASLPLTSPEQVLNRSMRTIAGELGISKRLTTHCARHTFAVSVCAERGISAETCAELMGITIATCVEAYYRVTSAKIERETAVGWKGL